MINFIDNHETAVAYGVPVSISCLQIVFIVLKLCGVITWNWWFVMLPIIIATGLLLTITIFAIVIACMVASKDDQRMNRD